MQQKKLKDSPDVKHRYVKTSITWNHDIKFQWRQENRETNNHVYCFDYKCQVYQVYFTALQYFGNLNIFKIQ